MEKYKDENFANARAVRNLFEKVITNQAARVANLEEVNEEILTTIILEDLTDEYDEKPLILLPEEPMEIEEELPPQKKKKLKLPESGPIIRR